MKSSLMRAPAVAELYHHKLSYQHHLKRLLQIRSDRRQQLQLDHTRQATLIHLKANKSTSFAHKFNQHTQHLHQSNLQLLNKLQHARPFVPRTSHIPHSSRDPLKPPHPTTQRNSSQTQRENSRIFFRMKSVSSTLSRDKMMNDYAKAQRLKDRITKYATHDSKVTLKSQKYLPHNSKASLSNTPIPTPHTRTERAKTTLASHYKKEEIISHRITNSEHRIFKQRGQNRPLPTLSQQPHYCIQEEPISYAEQKNAMFTTQPQGSRKRSISIRPK